MEKKPTKYYSSIQESRIADYLGWSAVSASGARPFNPGDIKSSSWLAECKTHTAETNTIVINKAVWKKISTEAKGCMKKPVLFVDNGTQEIEHTWVVVPKKVCFGQEIELISMQCNESAKKLTFKHDIFYKQFKGKSCCAEIFIDSESLYILRAHTFKELFCQGSD
jgi:hypothetical protein